MSYRITHINTSAGVGGGERLLLELARFLHGREFQFDFILPERGTFCDRLEKAGLPYRVVDMTGKLNPAAALALHRTFRRQRPDVVHTWGARASWYARVPARAAGVPLVFCTVQNSLHDYPYPAWRRSLYMRLEAMTGAVVDQWIAVSDALRDDMVQRYGLPSEKIEVVVNGVSQEQLAVRQPRAVVRERLGLASDSLVLIEVARMTQQKGQRFLLEAFRMLLPLFPQLHCVLVGDGPDRGSLEGQAARLGIAGRVHFLGFRPDVADLLNACDIAVLPSLSEGMPLAVLESMGVGCATVATRVNGTAEIITDQVDGLLIPPGDVRALVDSVTLLARNPEMRQTVAAQGRETVSRRFTAERMAATVGDLYHRRLGERKPSGDLRG